MEWAIFFSVLVVYGCRFFGFAHELLKKPEPSGPFRRPEYIRRNGPTPGIPNIRWPDDLNDLTNEQMERFIAGMAERGIRMKERGLPEKVNWKVEGF